MSMFDRFASATSDFVARAPFFVACVLLVVLWAPSILILGDVDTWQLIINTVTTIVTFLMVALLQNDQARFEKATNEKLNAIADALAGTLDDPAASARLRHAAGIEDELSTS